MNIRVSDEFIKKLKGNEKKYKISRTKKALNMIGKMALVTSLCVTTVYGVSINVLRSVHDDELKKNTIIYADQISEYNQRIDQYANDIKELNLNHLQIIMKVMNDIWNEIDGYAVAKDLPTGYFRLTFQEEGVGVCTSFADDFTARMNTINPEYNARNIIVYMDLNETNDLKVVDIERNISEDSEDNKTIEMSETEIKLLQAIVGNHMVSLIDIPDSDITMMVDTTNLLVGVLRNGRIYVLNNNNDKLLDYKLAGSYIFTDMSFGQFLDDYVDSFSKTEKEMDEIITEYGLDAQVNAFDDIRNLDGIQKKLEKL